MNSNLLEMDLTSAFITFEGGEGSGKTTIIKRIAELLTDAGYEVMLTREPGGVKIAEQIRSIILDNDNTAMDGRTEALLYAGARRQHLIEKVIPALKEGKVVLCDRFVDSSLAYQGHARGIGLEEIWSINEFAIGEHMPDFTFYLDIEPAIGLKRVANRGESLNRLDLEKLDFHNKVREGYLELVNRYDRITKVDANKSIQLVLDDVMHVIKERYKVNV